MKELKISQTYFNENHFLTTTKKHLLPMTIRV